MEFKGAYNHSFLRMRTNLQATRNHPLSHSLRRWEARRDLEVVAICRRRQEIDAKLRPRRPKVIATLRQQQRVRLRRPRLRRRDLLLGIKYNFII